MKRIICFSILLVLLLPFTFVGYLYAGPPKKIVNAFTYCYDGKDTGIEKILDIDGYFSELYICGEEKRKSYTNLMFYPNGIVTTSMLISDEKQRKERQGWDMGLAVSRIASGENKKESKWFYEREWGRYIIHGDTIKIQHIHKRVSLNDSWIGWETWYKVVDRKTIKVIKQRQLWKLDYYDFTQSQVDEYCRRVTATFKPLSVKPRFDKTWILKEKWFWCNENDWREFMKTTEDKK